MEREMPHIPYEDVLHYLGCKEVDDQTRQQIVLAIEKVQQIAKPKIVYQIVTLQNKDNELGIPLIGNDVMELLETCDQAIFLAATLGSLIDVETKRLSIKDMGAMLVFDAVCNAGIEAVANEVQEEWKQQFLKKQRYLTDRFSCGYGDYPIDVQKAFCEALDTRRKIGLFVNESFLLLPLKSITAVIGISKEKQPKCLSGCTMCDLKDVCLLRKGGKRCGT